MKKVFMIIMLTVSLGLSACGKEEKPGASATEEVDKFASELKDKVGDSVSLPSETVAKAIAKTWRVLETGDIYTMKTDGTGLRNDAPFIFECGFDEDKNITLQIEMEDTDEEELYAITTDTTGYGIILTSLKGEGKLSLLPADMEFLEMTDDRAAGLLGEWADESGNKYLFENNMEITIAGSDSEMKGTYSAVENAEGKLLLNMVVSGGTLEFEYTLAEDGAAMELQSPGTEKIHHWTKQ